MDSSITVHSWLRGAGGDYAARRSGADSLAGRIRAGKAGIRLVTLIGLWILTAAVTLAG